MTRPSGPELHEPVLSWYADRARDLPWRRAGASPWAILVSEIMLQQTSVVRVLPAYAAWLDRWPTPADLAADSPGEAVRQWGRLGYPRRALRLHAAAMAIVDQYGGQVPSSYDELRALPGIGAYTAAAIASFAFRQRHPVLDTNVRRVLARVVEGKAQPAIATTAAETRTAAALLPELPDAAATWGVAVMELGALVCTSRSPRCSGCPIAARCAWRLSGHPEPTSSGRRQSYAGTDREVRGRLLAVLRQAAGSVPRADLDAVWADERQRARALDGLVADGLVEPLAGGAYRLPA